MPASMSKPFPNSRPRYGRSTVSPRSACRASRSAAACAISAQSWDGTDTLRTPDYTLFDAMIRYETGPWRFQVNASNLADKRQRHHLPRPRRLLLRHRPHRAGERDVQVLGRDA